MQIISSEFYKQWKLNSDWITNNLKALSDDDLKNPLSSGKNHGIWILGHLISSEDELCKYLGKGELMFPEYIEMFGQGSSLETYDNYPDAAILRNNWNLILERNDKIIKEINDEEWNEPHSGEIGETDFFKTKGRCLFIWNLHQAFHNGQLTILISNNTKP
jgi:hypothetical protein